MATIAIATASESTPTDDNEQNENHQYHGKYTAESTCIVIGVWIVVVVISWIPIVGTISVIIHSFKLLTTLFYEEKTFLLIFSLLFHTFRLFLHIL